MSKKKMLYDAAVMGGAIIIAVLAVISFAGIFIKIFVEGVNCGLNSECVQWAADLLDGYVQFRRK